MEFFAHTQDATCPYEEAIRLKEQIQSPVKFRTFVAAQPDPKDNHTFVAGENVDRFFYYQLKEALTPGVECGPYGLLCVPGKF